MQRGSHLEDVDLAKSRRGAELCGHCGKGPMVVDQESGEQVCSKCGYVGQEKMEEHDISERVFAPEDFEKRIHTGPPESIASHDKGLSTVVGRNNVDFSGKPLGFREKAMMGRLRMQDSWSMAKPALERNLRRAFAKQEQLVRALGLSEGVKNEAAKTYREVVGRGLVRGRSLDSLAVVSIYAACRKLEVPRTLKDFANESGIKKKDLARDYRTIHVGLDMRQPVADPGKLITSIGNLAHLSEPVQRLAREIQEVVSASEIGSGKAPASIVAASLYTAGVIEGVVVTQKSIAEAAKTTEVTVRNRYKEINEMITAKFGKDPRELVADRGSWKSCVDAARRRLDGDIAAMDKLLVPVARHGSNKKIRT